MTNAPIILRLSNDDGSEVRLNVSNLVDFLDAVDDTFGVVTNYVVPPPLRTSPSMTERPASRIALLLTAPPRRACLELLFTPEFNLTFDIKLLVAQFGQDQHSGAEFAFGDVLSAGTLVVEILALLYARWRTNSLPDVQSPLTRQMLELASKRAQGSQLKFQKLRRAAMKLGSSKVELIISEEIRVVITDTTDRRRAIAVSGNKFPPGGGFIEGSVIECASAPVKVSYKGNEYDAFCARPGGRANGIGTIVVVWGSENPVPRVRERSTIRYETIVDPDAVQMIGSPEDSFAAADGAIFVNQSSGFR